MNQEELLQAILEAVQGTNERLDVLQAYIENKDFQNQEEPADENKSIPEAGEISGEQSPALETSVLQIESDVSSIQTLLSASPQNLEGEGTSNYQEVLASLNDTVEKNLTALKFTNTVSVSLLFAVSIVCGILFARSFWRKL